MKKYILVIILSCLLLTGCGSNDSVEEALREQIVSIAELATIKGYYHNVADAGKEKGEGITHIGEVDRKYWVEYEGYVTVGIDSKDINPKKDIKVKGEKIIISLPKAKIIDTGIKEGSYNLDSVYKNDDSIINKNEITNKDINEAMEKAHNKMKEEAEKNLLLYERATEEIKEIIRNYIKQINELTEKNYTVEFKEKK